LNLIRIDASLQLFIVVIPAMASPKIHRENSPRALALASKFAATHYNRNPNSIRFARTPTPRLFGGCAKHLIKSTQFISLHSLDTVWARVLWNTILVANGVFLSRIDETLATFCSTFEKDAKSISILGFFSLRAWAVASSR
jgi:hypothetical protein